MRKLALSGLIVALFGLPMGLVTTGCSDDTGGNEDKVLRTTKGTVAPDTPQTQEEFYQRQKAKKK
jgi:hypothetical protein